jgi:hypothetical protein
MHVSAARISLSPPAARRPPSSLTTPRPSLRMDETCLHPRTAHHTQVSPPPPFSSQRPLHKITPRKGTPQYRAWPSFGWASRTCTPQHGLPYHKSRPAPKQQPCKCVHKRLRACHACLGCKCESESESHICEKCDAPRDTKYGAGLRVPCLWVCARVCQGEEPTTVGSIRCRTVRFIAKVCFCVALRCVSRGDCGVADRIRGSALARTEIDRCDR